MSNSGKKSPLQLNVESQLTVNQGFAINATAAGYQGTWTAGLPYTTPTAGSYSQGTVTSTNCTGILTGSLPNFYNNTPATNSIAPNSLCVPVYRNIIRIGRPIDSRRNNDRINCPALGNCRPDKFTTWFPGYGSFKETASTPDQFYNNVPDPGSGNWNMVESTYPPFSYPASPEYSYVYQNWSSTVPGPGATTDPDYNDFASYEQPYQYFQEYSWLTGWPGINAWQQNNAFGSRQNRQNANVNDSDLDSYGAAYFPRPDLASVQPWRTRDRNKIEYDEYFRFGYIATLARQAYYEFWSEWPNRRSNQYYEFCRSMNQNFGWQVMTNYKIASFYETKSFLKGTYSNINDLTTADLAGVNLAFADWGNDMIALGKSLDLASINTFGLPSAFLKHLQANNALTDALKFALFYQNLDTQELEEILQPTSLVSVEQERKIYEALQLIQGEDLLNIRVILDIATENLVSLADLINPRKMFPNSYASLTVPRYSIDTNSAKIYDFIYNGDDVNPRIENWGVYLDGILPENLAQACGAFMCAMCQVKNIQQMNVQSLSQAIANLEVTNKDLPLINTNTGVPGNVELADQELARIALGSGSMGVFRFADFLGAMSGWPYRDFYAPAQRLLAQLQTTSLTNVYKKLYQKSLFNNWALISRGKGYADPDINTTGIPASYTYNIFTANGNGIGAQTMGITGGNVNQYNIFSNTSRSSTSPSAYTTGQLVTFQPSDSASTVALAETYVVTGHSSGSVSFESILDLIPNPNYQPNPALPNYDPVAQIPPYSGWPGLSRSVGSGERVFVWELEYNGYPGDGILDGTVQNLVDGANLEILSIQSGNPDEVSQLNYYWDRIGTQHAIQQRAIPLAVPYTGQIFSGANREDIDAWVRTLEEYAQETGYCEVAPIIDAISDLNNVGGQSIVGAQREARNARRLANVGTDVNNDVPDSANPAQAQARAIVDANGLVTSIEVVIPGSGYVSSSPPGIFVYPQGGVFGGEVFCNSLVCGIPVIVDGSVVSIPVISCDPCYNPDNPPSIIIDPPPPPVRPGGPVVPGSWNVNPYAGVSQDPVPDNLTRTGVNTGGSIPANVSVAEAIQDVTNCNCECWVQQ